MQPAIRIEGISKQYRIGSGGGGTYRTLRESVSDGATAMWRRATRLARRQHAAANGEAHKLNGRALHESNGHAVHSLPEEKPNTFWALKDVSFDVQPGEVVGIIGRNGAGKSTLLKILSRITEPTRGKVILRGRVGSLLEVGTGFHQELSGRENIYMNGSILGMTRREIAKKFDEIVEFAEVEQFLDTPVKRYSSGMYVRLAFAVAAHMEPEILIVDEVLAVGDAQFQRKCLGRLSVLAQHGRTILFVSHNLGTVASLCSSAAWLHNGELRKRDAVRRTLLEYQSVTSESISSSLLERTDRSGTGTVRLSSIQMLNEDGSPCDHVLVGEPIDINVSLYSPRRIGVVEVLLWILDEVGMNVTYLSNRLTADQLEMTAVNSTVICSIPRIAVAPGTYTIEAQVLADGNLADHIRSAASFTVDSGPFFQSGRTPERSHGVLLTEQSWSLSD